MDFLHDSNLFLQIHKRETAVVSELQVVLFMQPQTEASAGSSPARRQVQRGEMRAVSSSRRTSLTFHQEKVPRYGLEETRMPRPPANAPRPQFCLRHRKLVNMCFPHRGDRRWVSPPGINHFGKSKYVARLIDNVRINKEKRMEWRRLPNHDACLRPRCFWVLLYCCRILTEILMQWGLKGLQHNLE